MTLARPGCLLLRAAGAVVPRNETGAGGGIGTPGTGRMGFGGAVTGVTGIRRTETIPAS
jgi:hypothetical protein